MIRFSFRFFNLVFLLVFSVQVFGQLLNPVNETIVWKEGKLVPYYSGIQKTQSPISKEQLEAARANAKNFTFGKDENPHFILPVKPKEGFEDAGYYSITAYFDHDTLYPDHLRDYNCGDLTYDLEEEYNHSGTDFFLWPFPWYKMENDEVEAVAAAPGILVYKQDSNEDHNCNGELLPWNGWAVLHADDVISWYVHMKENSLTEKSVGETVEAGEFLGVVGSSGISFVPHLHFEVYDSTNSLIDPFVGPCNPTISESWWEEQPAYKASRINKICTNNHLPDFGDCPEIETINEQKTFYPGDSIYLLSYFAHLFPEDSVKITLTRPGNSIHSSWFWQSPWEYYSTSWLYFFTILDNSETFGWWNYNMEYKGETYSYNFEFKNPQSTTDHLFRDLFNIQPNPVSDQLNITSNAIGSFRVEFYNSLGRVKYSIQPKKNHTAQINVSDWPKGVYVVRISWNEGYAVEKIIVN